jgi:TldD protein
VRNGCEQVAAFESRLGLDDGLYRRVLQQALARGGDDAELFFQQRSSTSLSIEDAEVKRASLSEDLGVGIRVVAGDAIGYAFSESLEERDLLAAARAASTIASGVGRQVAAVAAAERPDRYPLARGWDTVEPAERMPILAALDQKTRAVDARVDKVRARLADSTTRVLIVDAAGRKVFDLQPMSVCSVACVVEQGDSREESAHSIGGRHGIELYLPSGDDRSTPVLDELSNTAVERALLLLDARRPPAGEMPLVLAAGSSGILLHEAIGHGMEADFNRKGISIYADKLGKPIAGPEVSIIDDGTIDAARGAINIDDEGVEGQRTVLVENGILRSYLHDRISARHYGVAPTGNGRRQSFRHPPLPRMRSTYMLDGSHDTEAIIGSVKKGIYAQSFTNGQVQIGAGDFTFYVKTGFLIEDGKLTAPIKDANIIGNGPTVLQDVTMVGNDMAMDQGGWTCGKEGQSVPVSLGMPTVKVKSITVGGVNG